jgi:hypothetical protein
MQLGPNSPTGLRFMPTLKMIDCEGCGTPIVIWPKEDPLCYNCKLKRANEQKRIQAAANTGPEGLGRWL